MSESHIVFRGEVSPAAMGVVEWVCHKEKTIMARTPPDRESELLTYSTNFKERIVAAPTLYGLTAEQATAYAADHDDYAETYQAANDPSTRTPAAVNLKNTAKKVLLTSLRNLSRIVQASPLVTDEQRIILGLPVRKTEPTPVNPPTEIPVLEIKARFGTTVTIKLHDGTGARGKPAGVAGATVFSYVGANPPTEASGWKFEGNIARTTVDVDFPSNLAPGTTVYLTAFWYNAKGQSGPGCAPVSTTIAGGAMVLAA
jgi:hypothetical protein